MSNMRGLIKFVTEIRYCQTDEEVQAKAHAELAKIRAKFAKGRCSGYDLKKYTWKLIYCFMLGIDVEFGHMEAVQLVAMKKYSEKNAGHIACTLMMNENMDMLRLIIQSMKKDLQQGKEEIQCLALHTVANVGGEEFAESLSGDVQKLLLSGTSRNFVRKKAALALLRLYRKYPDIIQPETFAPQIINAMDDNNIGVVTSISALMLGLVSYESSYYHDVIPVCIKLLGILLTDPPSVSKSYVYYKTACPWLQVKLLRILQYFGPPDPQDGQRLGELLAKILSRTVVTKSVNKNNSDYSILFEAVNLIIHLNLHGLRLLQNQTLQLLGRFVGVREPNIRYLGLEAMSRFARIEGSLIQIREHQSKIQFSLKQDDISVRRRALDLMFSICDENNVEEIVEQLLQYLARSDFAIREEMVLKIAILAERYATDFRWYVDIVLRLIAVSGDFVSEDILYRVVQIVSIHDYLHQYAAKSVLEELKSVHAHEALVRVGGYLLGEYGHLLEEKEDNGRTQFEVLHRHFLLVEPYTKAVLLTAFAKIASSWPRLQPRIDELLEAHLTYVDQEIQQRAIEYTAINEYDEQSLSELVWEVMPPFSKKQSILPKLLRKKRSSTVDRNIWVKEEKKDGYMDDIDEEEEEEEDEDEEYEEEEIEVEEVVEIEEDSDYKSEEEEIISNMPPQQFNQIRKLMLEDSGALYDSDMLQIGCRLQLSDTPNLKMILYYGNKTDGVLENITLSEPEGVVDLKMKPNGPFDVKAGKQGVQMLLWTSRSPFPACPEYVVTFYFEDEEYNLFVRLPLCVTRFASPLELDAAGFKEYWVDNDTQHQFTIQSSGARKVSSDVLRNRVLPGMQIDIIEGLDSNSDNVVGAGTFNYLSSSTQEPKSAPMLVRIQNSENGLRVTLRSSSPLVNQGLESALTFIFDPPRE